LYIISARWHLFNACYLLHVLHALQAQLQAPEQLDKEVRALQKQAVAQWKAERAAQEAQQQQQEEQRQRWQRQQQAEQLQRKRADLKQQIEAAKAAKQQEAAAQVGSCRRFACKHAHAVVFCCVYCWSKQLAARALPS
jgi:hypothetical protein